MYAWTNRRTDRQIDRQTEERTGEPSVTHLVTKRLGLFCGEPPHRCAAAVIIFAHLKEHWVRLGVETLINFPHTDGATDRGLNNMLTNWLILSVSP